MNHFDEWNIQKQKLDAKVREDVYFHEGDIWWISLGKNIGFELNGKGESFIRPVIVIRKYNRHSFLALPISTSTKVNSYKYPIGIVDGREAVALLSQMRNIDANRLVNKIGRLEHLIFLGLKKKASEVNFN